MWRHCQGAGYRFVAPVEGTQTAGVPGGSGVRRESRMAWGRRTSILFVVLLLLAAAGLFIYKRLQVSNIVSNSGHSPASLLTMVCRSAPRGHQTAASSPTVPTVAASSNLGAAGQRWRSSADHERTRTQLAAGLVARREVHCVSIGERRGRPVHHTGVGRCRIGKKDRIFRILPSLVARRLADLVPDNIASFGHEPDSMW